MKTTLKNLMMLAIILSAALSVNATEKGIYKNPVINTSLPDPSVIKGGDGYYYLYATENIRNMPIYRSMNLVDWEFVGTAFTDKTRPKWNPKGGLWAPDVTFVKDKYVMYYAKSEWGGEWSCGIGVAIANRPGGPFFDHGALFTSKEIGVQNSIDPFYIEDNGKKYLFWGSFRGIYGVQLSDDGLSVMPGAKPKQIAGTFMEATYIHKIGNYYYLFGSAGTCCEGAKSTYRLTYGRSIHLFGPYLNKQGEQLLDNKYEVLLHKGNNVVGPGHNSELILDDNGKTWMFYHGFNAQDPDAGRLVYMDEIKWFEGWPMVTDSVPSVSHDKPLIGHLELGDPTIFYENNTYYLYGTSSKAETGFVVYTSKDLKDWTGPAGAIGGYALKGNTYGTNGFWAPQVFKKGGKYYMAYTANEQLAIAESDSPLGPFTQKHPAMLPAYTKEIDPCIFFDTDGKAYMYHVRLDNGNRIYVAEMNDDMKSMKEETSHECLHVDQDWENTAHIKWTICEGPAVTKIGDTYYLFYSCNDFRNIDYAVGYATSKSPYGPWEKQSQPIISRKNTRLYGPGHGDIFLDADGKWKYVFHAHRNDHRVAPRRAMLINLNFKKGKFSIDKKSITRLINQKAND